MAANYKTDKLYQALKAALGVAKNDYERNSVQSVITNLRHECAWADPDSPLEQVDDAMISRHLTDEA